MQKPATNFKTLAILLPIISIALFASNHVKAEEPNSMREGIFKGLGQILDTITSRPTEAIDQKSGSANGEDKLASDAEKTSKGGFPTDRDAWRKILLGRWNLTAKCITEKNDEGTDNYARESGTINFRQVDNGEEIASGFFRIDSVKIEKNVAIIETSGLIDRVQLRKANIVFQETLRFSDRDTYQTMSQTIRGRDGSRETISNGVHKATGIPWIVSRCDSELINAQRQEFSAKQRLIAEATEREAQERQKLQEQKEKEEGERLAARMNPAWDELARARRLEIKSLQQRGDQKARKLKSKWTLVRKVDQMSGLEDLSLVHQSQIGTGKAEAKFVCEAPRANTARLSLTFTFFGISVPTRHVGVFAGRHFYNASVKQRINDKISSETMAQSMDFGNVYKVDKIFTVVDDPATSDKHLYDGSTYSIGGELKTPVVRQYIYDKSGTWVIKGNQRHDGEVRKLPEDPIYDIAYQVATSGGDFFIEVTPQLSDMSKLIRSCPVK